MYVLRIGLIKTYDLKILLFRYLHFFSKSISSSNQYGCIIIARKDNDCNLKMILDAIALTHSRRKFLDH